MTPTLLKSYTCKDLAQMAKQRGVPGWHSMRKDQLVRALLQAAKKKSSDSINRRAAIAKSTPSHRPSSPAKRSAQATRSNPRIQKKISQLELKLEELKNLASMSKPGVSEKDLTDRLVVMVRDPYWLHAYWELSGRSVDRAQAAMGQHWHTAKPILRLFQVADDGNALPIRDINIHGGVNNWYLDVQDPPNEYRCEIGYLATDGNFYALARSNTVETPPAGTSDALDQNWANVAENADRIFAMSGGYSPHGTSQELQELLEERLHRPMGSPMSTRFGSGAAAVFKNRDDFQFAVDAELVIYGITERNAHLTLKGEPVQLRPDGSFSVRLNLTDRRQVIPIVASAADGVEQQTIILAVERNTKVMEPVVRDLGS